MDTISGPGTISEPPVDAPDADVAEQAQPASPDVEEPEARADELTRAVPEADEYDAAEQRRVVEIDDDEYR